MTGQFSHDTAMWPDSGSGVLRTADILPSVSGRGGTLLIMRLSPPLLSHSEPLQRGLEDGQLSVPTWSKLPQMTPVFRIDPEQGAPGARLQLRGPARPALSRCPEGWRRQLLGLTPPLVPVFSFLSLGARSAKSVEHSGAHLTWV